MRKLFKKIYKFASNRKYRVAMLARYGYYNRLSDEKLLKKVFKSQLGYSLNLENPTTFNEKLQWLKLYDRKPIYTTMVDKYEAKKYVSNIIGEQHIIPTLGVWERFEDIDFDLLPDQFVLKCTNDSGGLSICRNKCSFDKSKAEHKIKKSLKRNYYLKYREWPYKNVKPRIIAEHFMKDRDFETLNVFKIFNFNGEPKIIQVIQGDKTANETIDYFDTEWNLLDLKQNYPNSKSPLQKPESLSTMLNFARQLTADDVPPFIRTDFYEVNGKVYFSEYTFYSDSGFAKFEPDEWDLILGNYLELTLNHNEP